MKKLKGIYNLIVVLGEIGLLVIVINILFGNWIIVSPVDLKEHYVKLLKAKEDSKIDSIIVKKDVLKVVPVKVK